MIHRLFFHVDLDAFYASVEQEDHPEYRGRPVIIGARPGTRGVVSTCSYEARAFGVRSAMPISEAHRRCPEGIYLPPRMDRYQEVSRQIMKLFEEFSPEVQQISVDEAFLNMTGTERLLGPPSKAARRLKERTAEVTGLRASVGVAGNRYLAKIASDFDKPNGLTVVAEGEELAFVDRLSLKNLWGLGAKTLERLGELNIHTVKDLRSFDREGLSTVIGRGAGEFLYDACRGIDPGIFNESPKSHSISNEITLKEDTSDRETLETLLLDLSHQVMFRSLEENALGQTVVLKLRFHDFTSTTVQVTLGQPVSSTEEIFQRGKELLEKRWDGRTPVRLLGVGLAQVRKGPQSIQGELFATPFERQKKVERAVMGIRKRGQMVIKASLLGRRGRKKPSGGK